MRFCKLRPVGRLASPCRTRWPNVQTKFKETPKAVQLGQQPKLDIQSDLFGSQVDAESQPDSLAGSRMFGVETKTYRVLVKYSIRSDSV